MDGTIWDKELATIDIIAAVVRGEDPITISLNGEGPCLEHIGLYDLLDRICRQFDYPRGQIIIETANFLEQHSDYCIKHLHQEYELTASKKLINYPTDKQFNNIRHFGHFIGHSNQHRLHLASHLYSEHAIRTVQSYHCSVTEPYHREHIGLESLMALGRTQIEIQKAQALIATAPLTLDLPPCQTTISVPANLGIADYYPTFFVELVNLTFFSGRTFYVDEKIWRPAIMMTPFIVQGPQNLILNLRRLGFQTFHDFWDEGYSEDPPDCQVHAIIEIVDRLSQKTTAELETMYASMLPILTHNRQRVLELQPGDFNRIFNETT